MSPPPNSASSLLLDHPYWTDRKCRGVRVRVHVSARGRDQEDLYIVKDAVFTFKGDKTAHKLGCDWHVDDAFFWPAALDANGPGLDLREQGFRPQ
jgi:hypothetical protein